MDDVATMAWAWKVEGDYQLEVRGWGDYSREAMSPILFEDIRFNIIFLNLQFRLLHLTGIFNGSSNCKLITTTVSNICLVNNSSKKC